MVYDFTPFDVGRRLWKAYDAHFKHLEPHEWAVIRDADTIYTTHNYGEIISFHSETNINFFTCLTNRAKCELQKDYSAPQTNDYLEHRKHGEKLQKSHFRKIQDITDSPTLINGYFMCIRKSLWDKIEPPKTTHLLGVDSHIHREIRRLGERIYLLRGLYIYHFFNNFDGEGERNISHLK